MRSFVHASWLRRHAAWIGVLAAGKVSSACLWNQSCTEAGCIDQATIAVHESDGSFVPLMLTIVVDGRTVKCSSETVEGGSCDEPTVAVSVQQLADCVETRTKDAVMESCTRNGKFQHDISIAGSPVRVDVTVTRPDGTTKQREFELDYELNRPNGPDCEPVCKDASADWKL